MEHQSHHERMFDILESLIDSRVGFFSNTINRIPGQGQSRSTLMSRFMLNELCYLEMANRVYQNSVRDHTLTNLLGATITLNMPNNFTDPVTVAPTDAQIETATEDVIPESQETPCAICQDHLGSSATRLRHCGHLYHRTCIRSWLSVSVRCPVCRHDVREVGPASQTSSVAE